MPTLYVRFASYLMSIPAASMDGSSSAGWNPLVAAGSYSALAGVVAVGALTAITLILTLRGDDAARGSWSLPLLLVSFPTLLIASLEFAANAGEEVHSRLFPEFLYSGILLAAGSLLFFLGIAWLLAERIQSLEIIRYARIAVRLLLFMSILFLFGYLGITRWAMTGHDWRRENAWWIWLILMLTPLATAMLPFGVVKAVRSRLLSQESPRLLIWTTLLIVIVAILGAMAVFGVGPRAFPRWLTFGVTLTLGLLFALFELSLPMGHTARTWRP